MDAILHFLRVVLIIGLILILLLLGGFVGVFAADAVFGPRANHVSNVSYPAADGSELLAYLNIQPGPELRPGIILIPDYWGLDQQMQRLTNHLSDAGYVVITPDMYRGAASAMIFRAYLLGTLITPGQANSDLQRALDYLTSLSTVRPDAIGVMGLGYGGGAALRFAAHEPRVSAVVNAYGAVITNADELRELRGPVKGVFAQIDPLLHPARVEQFGALLDEAGIENELTIYENMTNGFLRFPDVTVIGRVPYEAWQDILAFFDRHLKTR